MPLIKSASKQAIGKNIEIEKHAHPEMSNEQAAAIAYSEGRKAGGHFPKPKEHHSESHHRHKEHR